MTPEIEAAMKRVADYFMLHYRVRLEDLNILDTPGYWQDKEPHQHPSHPIHGCLFCKGPFKATYTYEDPTQDLKTGRFLSPHRTWKMILGFQRAQEATA